MWLIASIISIALALFLHAAICRLPRPGNTVVRFFIVGSVVGCALILILALSYGFSPQLMAGTLVYAFLCEFYIFFFTLTISSVSANLLLNLSYGGMTQQQIDRKYDSSLMVTQRIDRMIATGLIKETGQGISLTARGRRLIGFLECLRQFFRHTASPD